MTQCNSQSTEAVLGTLFAHNIVPTHFRPLANSLEDLFATLTEPV